MVSVNSFKRQQETYTYIQLLWHAPRPKKVGATSLPSTATDPLTSAVAAPHEFTSLPFPVKALKIVIRDLQSGGDSATISAQGHTFDVDSDDGVYIFINEDFYELTWSLIKDEEWTEEERQNQGFKAEEFEFLSEMLGPKGVAFDNDDLLDVQDDEDLKSDPVSQMDMQVSRHGCLLQSYWQLGYKAHLVNFLKTCVAQNTANFNQIADQLSAEEMLVLRSAIGNQ